MAGLPHEQHLARFTANPDDRVSFEFLEEHLFMAADWPGLADLYRRRRAAPSLADRARQRAEISMRLAQVCEERLDDTDAAILAYTEAVQLEPRMLRALRQLRRIYESRGSWEVVLQVGEQEAALAESAEERARAYVLMADVWHRRLGDAEQAEQLYARARREGWDDPRAPKPEVAEDAAPASESGEAELASEVDIEWDGVPDLECDLESAPADEPQATLTMPDFEDAPVADTPGDQRSSRVLGVLERKLASRDARGAGLDAESLHLRLRIAELRANVLRDPVAAIAALEPALSTPSALLEVAPMLAGLYEQLGRSEPLIDLAERAASACEPRDQRTGWVQRAADAARAAGDSQRAIACYQRLLADLPHDLGARAALADLYRSRAETLPLVNLLREELPRASRDRELELQLELASLVSESLGDPSGAIPHWRRCLELAPSREDLLERALSACALDGGPLAQLDLVEHVCESADTDTARAALLARRGVLLADALAWNDEAAQSWRAALALEPNQPLARARLGAV